MISKSVLGTIIRDQSREFGTPENPVQRSVFKHAVGYGSSAAFIIKGVRRCGKSTMLKQILEAKFKGSYHYFNFDDDRIINFKAEDFQALMEVLTELYGEKRILAFDEIQNVKGWEMFVNRLLRQGHHVFITGSNANLLSKELGTHLTGRHVDMDLYPFSFTEFLAAKGSDFGKKRFYSTSERATMLKMFKDYLIVGGMPEAVMFSNDAVLTQITNDIIQKDIIPRYDIRQSNAFKTILGFLISNASNHMTFRSILNNFDVKSATTIQKYVEYMEETYLLFSIKKYESKVKLLDKNPRKIYCIDNGIIIKNTPSIRDNKGALLENLIAIQLKRLAMECYYYKGAAEADFVLPKEKQVIQVCYELNAGNKEREANGLLEAMGKLKTKEGIILTLDQEQEFIFKNHKVLVKPAWQWLLENEPQ